ncbi:MAG: penicillin-binding protein 2 [Patescibacteria group bacterium]|nr:penicillin-binding protein 2 [Patescibacteria group bacterium]
MTSKFNKKKDNKKAFPNNNRLNYLIVAVFFIFVCIVYQLYSIQIINHDKYVAKASLQHNIYSELKSQRGEIYLRQNNSDFYPLATNKEYVAMYINPRALYEEEILALLQHVFDVFHRSSVEKEVDNLLAKQEQEDFDNELEYINSLDLSEDEKNIKREELISRHNSLESNEEWQEFKKTKRELEIKEREQNIINDYFEKVNVRDKYSRLVKRKIEKEELINFYFSVLREKFSLNSPEDLFIKNGKVLLVSDGRDVSLEIEGFSYTWETFRYYPDKETMSILTGFSNMENVGNYGLEGFFNSELSGEDGFLLGDKGSYQGRRIIIDKKEYKAPVNGNNIVLTIDYGVQMSVCQKLKEAQLKHQFNSGSVIIMDPKTGKIIAMCSWPGYDPNNYQEVEDSSIFDDPNISRQYEPGSVFKTITMAAAIDQGKISPDTFYNDLGQLNIKGWPKPIKNSDFSIHGGHGWVNMNYVLENSLNTGAIFAASQIGPQVFAEYLEKFGFNDKTGIELSGEISGNFRNLLSDKVKDIDFATASFGQGVAVTPLQMISAYSAIANKGVLMKPYIVDEILDENNQLIKKTEPQIVRRVISEQTAETVSAMLVNVVENGHAKKSKIDGYYIGGKTGTAQIPSPRGGYLEGQYVHNFLGYGPIEDPKFVMLVKFDSPKTSVYAEGTVVPVFGEIIDFLLKYYQIPKSR